MSDKRIYAIMIVIFVVPLSLFVWLTIRYFPNRLAVMIIGLAGFTVMTVGPFWAMMLEKRLREILYKKDMTNEKEKEV